jgi:PAS domain S-box-containing protein
MIPNVLDLIFNLAVLVAFSVISGVLRQRKGRVVLASIHQGAMFGLLAVIGMMRPLHLGPGVIFDGRSVLISVCGLFFGPLAVGIAGGMALLYRVFLGGPWAAMGALVIASSACLGLLFHRKWTRRGPELSAPRLLGFGLLVSLVTVLLLLTGHVGGEIAFLTRLGLPILLAYSLATMLIGRILVTFEAAARTTETLRESEERFRQLAEIFPETIFEADIQGKWTFANEQGYEQFRLAAEDLDRGMSIFDRVIPADLPKVRQRISDRMGGLTGGFLEFSALRCDGSTFDALAYSSPITRNGIPVGIRGFILDVSARKRSERAMLDANQRLSLYVDQTPLGVIEWDLDFRVVRWNRAAERIFGHTAEEAVGRHAKIIIPDDADSFVEEVWRPLLEGRGRTRNSNANVRKDGSIIQCKWYNTVLLDSEGRAVGVTSLVEDITEQRAAAAEKAKLQAQLQQAQKMECLGLLAGGVAHDMNNVLGAILAFAETNIEVHPAGSRTHRAFDTIARAASRGGKLAKSLLSFARQSPAEEHELNVNSILNEQVEFLGHTTLAKIRLQLDLEPELWAIRGDASALSHAFMNLCVNAMDAMPEGGTLTIRTRNLEAGWIGVLVLDTGCGMSREVLEKAIDPFFTTKGVGKGTGLGLSMVFNTVKAHRGQLDIQSSPGYGTSVEMRFPVCECRPKAKDAGSRWSEPLSGVLTALVVDDDEMVRSAMRAMLEGLGHAATVVSCGEEALARLEAGFWPDVVILDMNMPGLGGAGTLPRLRALRPTLPVLLCTGRADQTALDLVAAHPHVTLLPKPLHMAELRQLLESVDREEVEAVACQCP